MERELDISVETFAYPQGDYNGMVISYVKAAGYTAAVTVDQGRATLKSDRFALPRFLVSGNTTPAMMRALVVPTVGPAYRLINFVFKRILGRKRWPRRAPGEIDSTGSVDRET
jgi:hypothetical protein